MRTPPRPDSATTPHLAVKPAAARLALTPGSSEQSLLPAAVSLFLLVLAGGSLLRLTMQPPRRTGWR